MSERDSRAVEAYNEGVAHARAGRVQEARAAYERALSIDPRYVQALNNLGALLDDAGDHRAAEAHIRAALALDDGRPELWTSFATNQRAQGRFGQARVAYQMALALDPEFAAARWNMALIDLADGNFADGWTGYLFRPSVDRRAAPLASPPLGDDLSGQVVEIVDEQGLGDALFFLRFSPELPRRGAAVRYSPDPRIAGIVGRMLDLTKESPTIRVALGDLPYLLNVQDCPPALPVKPLPERLRAMREVLRAAGPPPYIGLTWRAGQEVSGYLSKSIPLDALAAAVRDMPGTVIDLQRAPSPGEHRALERAAGRAALDLSERNADLEDMLALMALLDEYIGVSNTNMHLRAALGAGARVLVVHPPEYRWMAAGESSPWFPGVRLYRSAPAGDWAEALAQLRADLHSDRAVLAHRAGDGEAAERHFALALSACPDGPRLHFNYANFLRDAGRPDAAEDHYRRAIAGEPRFAPAHNNLGNLFRAQKRWDEAAACYRDAIATDAGFAPAHRNLADLDEAAGRIAEATAGWARTISVRDDAGLRVRDALAIPVIPSSVAEIDDYRARMAQKIEALAASGLRLEDPLTQVGATPFYLGYHGREDRPLMEALAGLYRAACPSLAVEAPHVSKWLGSLEGGPIRIGIASTFLRDHTVGRLTSGLIGGLSRERFEVRVFDRLPRNLDAARREIAAAELDILYYPDVGMEPLTYFLAFARLAPIQCVSWGHPVTTGMRSVDYFVSSRLLEPDEADAHYTERLARLDSLPSSVAKPEGAAADAEGPVFLCAQSLFKFHPDFDRLIGRILAQCPGAELAVLDGQYPDWARLLEARWRRTIPDVIDRIRFVGRRDRSEFMALLASARVVLDTPHFCGGLSSFEALVAGSPVVALPGAYMRGRVTLGLYRRMGLEDMVARDGDAYVDLAVRLARDDNFNRETRARIGENAPKLIADPAPIAEHARFFEKATYEAI